MRGERDLYREKIEVSLDGKQVFYLFFGGAVIASTVFVVGVLVGKRLESRAHADHVTSAEVARHDPLAALDMLAGTGGDDLSFPSELRRPRSDAPVLAMAKPSADAKDRADLATGVLAGEKSAEQAAETAEAKLKAEAERKTEEEAKRKAEAKLKAERKTEEEAKRKAEAEAKAKAKRKAEAEAKAKAKAEARSGRFTLQLSSFQSETEAEAFHDQLRAAGYRPYVSRAEVPGKGTWFRVRLGKYPSYETAVTAKGKFEKSQKIIAYVTRL